MRPLFLDRGFKLRKVARQVAIAAGVGVALAVGYYCLVILSGLARIVSQVCP